MFSILKRNPLAAAIAIAMHLVIILLMVFGLDWLEKPQAPKFKVDVVQARMVDASKVDAEVKRLKQAEQQKKSKAEADKLKEKKRLEELRKKRRLEEKRIADLKKKRKQHEEAEAKRKVEEKKRKAEQEKKRKAEQEKKRQQAAKEKKRKEAEAKRLKEEEAKKRKLEEQHKIEEQLRADMQAERDATEFERYQVLIQQAVTASWLRPIGVGEGLKCTLRIRMATGGNVIAAEVIQGSGNGAFDRSARVAVLKAGPLPVPSGRLFERFRDINFEFAPSGGD